MTYYKNATEINTTPRIHPVLVSLCLEKGENETLPNMYSVSANDPRVAENCAYTPIEYFPPLDIHSPGQSCMSPVCDADGFTLTLPRQITVKNVCFPIAQTLSQK
jgi:hypothetical protein